ncbi:glycerophosphodiester phosphodiesterase family protein [Henriciella aquimarina]|uniref:glycerophosphodiester phosphodiesterase family protein n=1 Tax=Henriciella aquimarina TaxID=545261 RepID=UPI0009FFEDA8|nr:glycerophosphodiester phosphodiesterase family protein [Henriciella aquimarina]
MAERFPLLDYAYAHRGLWREDGRPENSLEAILAAADAGLGCEIDVRPAACGTPVVFHDPVLDRMTDQAGLVSHYPADYLETLYLKGRGTFARLSKVLDAWPGETPLLIEMKIDGSTDAFGFARLVSERVAAHKGPAALMSFSPRAVSSVEAGLMKGALVMPSLMTSDDLPLDALISSAAGLTPDYLACHVTDAEAAARMASDYGLPMAVWTVPSADIAKKMARLPVAQIFEGFDPAFARPGT